MFYKFSDFYKRDVSFVYSQEKNPVNWLTLRAGNSFEFDSPVIFEVDKIDSYINDYDVLPTIGIPLVSNRFKGLFQELANSNEIAFYAALIIDENGNENKDFWGLNILNVIPCLDKSRSIYEVDEDDFYSIKKWYINPLALAGYSIIRMAEQKSYIIVTDDFKNKCEDAKLKGVNFIEEGHSIYKGV